MAVYQKGEQWESGEFPAILAVGDSWFWYPKNNLLEALSRHPRLSRDFRHIQAVGYSGALLQRYVGGGSLAGDVAYNLSLNIRRHYNVFMISGAGNDAIDYQLALAGSCHGITEPEQCFDPVGLDALLETISRAMGALIHDIRWAYKNEQTMVRPIFIHGYDYPVPDGRGFMMGPVTSGPWLKPALDKVGLDPDLQFRIEVTRLLIDRLNDLLALFENPANDVAYIDTRGVLRNDRNYHKDWDNEMHPTWSGFRKIVDQRWIPELARWGIARE
jgi:hypothetical protein